MNEHKFTADDVIKAYELCFTPKGTTHTCAKCPFHEFRALCKVERDRAALTLINRQKAEIESLKKIGDYKTSEVLRHDAAIRELHKQLETAKAEAIKEFAERLKPKLSYYDWIYVDNLVKEMTEAENES